MEQNLPSAAAPLWRDKCEVGTAGIRGALACSPSRYGRNSWGAVLFVKPIWSEPVERWLAPEVDTAKTPGALPCLPGRYGRNPWGAMVRGGQKVSYPAGSIE